MSTLFETAVIGSLPRPESLLVKMAAHKRGDLSEDVLENFLDTIIPDAIRLQERAGIDIITDGEWRRPTYVSGFSNNVVGFAPDKIEVTVLGGSKRYWPAVVEKLRYVAPIVADEVAFVMRHTTKKVKATLPSPYMVDRWFYDPVYSKGAYPTRESLIEDAAGILRQELLRLRDLGVYIVQFDDAMIGRFVGDAYNSSGTNPNVKITMADRERELEFAIQGLNMVVDGVQGVKTAMHVCRGHRDRKHVSHGGYGPVIAALGRARVGLLAMEFAAPDCGSLDVLRDFPEDKILGLGVIDVLSREVDPVSRLIDRVEDAARYVDVSRISLNPDCGFAPSNDNPISLEEASQKLARVCEASLILRERYSSRGVGV